MSNLTSSQTRSRYRRFDKLKKTMWEKHRVSHGLSHFDDFKSGPYIVAHTPGEFIDLALARGEIDEKYAEEMRDLLGWLGLSIDLTS